MEYRTLGRTSIKVSKICLGTMTWGYQNTEAEAHEQLDYALSQGINFIDTAEIYAVPPLPETYGKTEKYIGTWLADRKTRDKIILATKVAGRDVSYIRDGQGLTPESIRQAVEGSLKRLQTDYIDLYQLHWPQRQIPLWGKLNYQPEMYSPTDKTEEQIKETLTVLQELQKAGKVRHFGLSNETSWGAMKFLQLAESEGLPRMESIQNAYNLIRREYETGLAEISMEEQISALPYSPLAGGILTGKYRNGAFPEGARYSTWGKERTPYNYNHRGQKAVEDFASLAEKLGITLTQFSLAFVNDQKFVTSSIIGATSLEQLEECISSANISLSDETRKEIDQLFTENPNPGTY